MKRAASESDRETQSVPTRQRDTERGPSPSKARDRPVESLHRTVGNQAVQRLHEDGVLQAKLTVNRPGDRYEREADRVAEQVIRMPEPAAAPSDTEHTAPAERIQRMCPHCQRRFSQGKPLDCPECEGGLQRKETSSEPPAVDGGLERQIQSLRGGGRPLSESERSFFEPRFGADFSGVRVHTDSKAAQMNRQLGAKAFTHGKDIYFDEGRYRPESSQGKHLLAHELVHVVQKTEGRIQKEEYVTREEIDLLQKQDDYEEIVRYWYEKYLNAININTMHARGANNRFIEFEAGGISELKALGAAAGGAIALFGGPAAVVGLCVTVLTNVAAKNLQSKEAKKAEAVVQLEGKSAQARESLRRMRDGLYDQIHSISLPYNRKAWMQIDNQIRSYGVPEIVPENIIYRDLLLALARGGGYNIEGGKWWVKNTGVFGKGSWYHSWDWGSPGWTNGRDIADALNALAEGDPSTRIEVEINDRDPVLWM